MLDGVDLSSVPPYQRPINMMFQSYALFPHMTVEQNIAFGLRLEHHVNRTLIRRYAGEIHAIQHNLPGGRLFKPGQHAQQG